MRSLYASHQIGSKLIPPPLRLVASRGFVHPFLNRLGTAFGPDTTNVSTKAAHRIGVPAPSCATERQVAGIGNVVELRTFNGNIFRRNHELPQTQAYRLL